MVKKEAIFDATEGGLKIILDCLPQASGCVGNKKKFKLREGERTPSACLYLNPKTGVWAVHDFGGEHYSPIDIFMSESGISRYGDAVLRLAEKYGIKDELDRTVNKPTISKRPAKSDEQEGEKHIEFNESFTDEELAVLGPKVTKDTVKALHWFSVKSITTIKNREAIIKESNRSYPIFARECLVKPADGSHSEVKFYKIYEVFNFEKAYRFTYYPAGIKPRDYINGLEEIKEAYRKLNAEGESEFFSKPENEGKPYHERKLEAAVICSGERDSLCAKSMGYHPIWFNSEMHRFTEEQYKEVMKYVEELYNIPDIDDTGRKRGRALAMQYIDLKTIWLPDSLATFKDNRGHPRKDLRDWMEMRNTANDFKNLVSQAMPAKFWQYRIDKNGIKTYYINTIVLLYFLSLNGYYILHEENKDDIQYVKITGNVVERVTARDMKQFVVKWTKENFLPIDIQNLTVNTTKLTSATLDALAEINPDFCSYTPTSQFFFFDSGTVEVSADDIKEEGNKSGRFVWKENIIPHRVKAKDIGEDFTIKVEKDADGELQFDIQINSTKSKFLCYLINSSRIHWRKELEVCLSILTPEEKHKYRQEHKYDICGHGLSVNEINEQKMALINKIFAFGYMLHHFKERSKAWAPMAMDYKIGEDSQCNGRSGKSLFFVTLGQMMKHVTLRGRDPKLMENKHLFAQVSRHTDMLFVDDCGKYLDPEIFYDSITGDLTVNPKGVDQYTIPFEESPKMAFTTNYVPQNFDPSSNARLLYMVFSDYYHEKTEFNDYRESRSPHDDFQKDLFGYDYTEEEWVADIGVFLQCCKFYLRMSRLGVKIQPPMRNIVSRHNKAEMGENFRDWAEMYFSLESGRLNKFIVRTDAFEDFKKFAGSSKMTMQAFSRKLKAFAADTPYIECLNPEEFCNAAGRILRRVAGSAPGQDTAPTDMIYLRTVKDIKVETDERDKDIPF